MYTMTFGPHRTQAPRTCPELRDRVDMYFHAATGSTLEQAFEEIADQLSNLRIAE